MENHRLSLSWHRGIRSSIRPCLVTTCRHQCVLLKRCYRISSGCRVLEEARGRAHHSRETAREKGDYETRRVGAPRPRRSPQQLGCDGDSPLPFAPQCLGERSRQPSYPWKNWG